MTVEEYRGTKVILARLPHNGILPNVVEQIASERGIRMGVFSVIGALKRAKLAYYDQRQKEYRVLDVPGPHEIASCIGNVSVYKRKPFAHAHVVLADEHGGTKAGHLLRGVIFAAELHMQELDGPVLERKPDRTTGLVLWQRARAL
jgi:hypothetical protein